MALCCTSCQEWQRTLHVPESRGTHATGQSSPPNAIVISGAAAEGTAVTGFSVQHAGLEGIFVVQTSRVTTENNLVREKDTYGPFNPLCANQPDNCGEAIHLQTVTNKAVKLSGLPSNKLDVPVPTQIQ